MPDPRSTPETPQQRLARWGLRPEVVLNHFDLRLHWGPLNEEDEALHQWLVEHLRASSREPFAEARLFANAKCDRIGAARVLRGIIEPSIRRGIAENIQHYLQTEPEPVQPSRNDTRRFDIRPSYVMPLALGTCANEEEARLLDQVARFRPKKRELLAEDRFFRLAAIDSLGLNEELWAQEILMRLLLESRVDAEVRQACRDMLAYHATAELLEKYQWLVEEPRQRVLRRLARGELGILRGLAASLAPFEEVMEDVDAVFYAAAARSSGLPPQLPEPNVCREPPAAPDKLHAPPRLPPRNLCQACIDKLVERGTLTPEEAAEEVAVTVHVCEVCEAPLALDE